MTERIKQARAWMQRAHPDKGGSTDEFARARAEFEAAKRASNSPRVQYVRVVRVVGTGPRRRQFLTDVFGTASTSTQTSTWFYPT